MVADLVSTGARVARTPFLALARFLQRQVTGPRCVLDVTVGALPDVRVRSAWLARLRRAATDPSVAAVVLRIESGPGQWAATTDLRETLLALREAGTPIYAALEAPGSGAMWLASACDRVFLVPTGQVALLGVGTEMTFFGAALEHLGVKPDFEAAGEYKSFGEAFTRTFASAANQEAMGAIIGDLQELLVAGLMEGRGLEREQVERALVEAPLSAEVALELGLVDQLVYDDELRDFLKEAHGKGTRLLDFSKWVRGDVAVERLDKIGERGENVAVVYLDGNIVMEDGGRGSAIRAKKVVPVLRQLRRDDSVKAVVLHVNSPGGSALASDLIWREVDLLQADKPVIACFEDIAASGGYYLAAPAHEIVARPGTLTGSIGVFGGKLVVGEGMRKLGVHTQQVGSAPNAHLFSPSRRFTPDQRDRFRASLQHIYDGFVERVAKGRGSPVDEVEVHCRGRVWTGSQARENGLVDHFGGLSVALDRACELAGLDRGGVRTVEVSTLPRLSAMQWALQRAAPSFRAAVPVLGVLEHLLPTQVLDGVQLLVDHQAEALALMPARFELR